MSIEIGSLAPTFRTEDIFGKTIDLQDYAGRTVLLSFFRNGACAICNLRVHQLITRYPDYQRRGLTILAVFESPRERLLESVAEQDAPFPIIADPRAALYDLYGVETSEEKVALTMQRPDLPEAIQEAAAHGFQLTHEEGSNFNRMPADFLIGPDLIVRQAHYADYVMDHLPFADIEQALGALTSV
jgi:peroxiredoxin Q/BCP